MANRALYVKLDRESYERLRRLSEEQRRQMGDQAALIIESYLDSLIEAEQPVDVAA